MSDERKPVICRYCGEPILENQWNAKYIHPYVSCRFQCDCGACTPWGALCETRKKAIEAAYAAATQRPPNKPLTEEQIMQCAVNVPLFCIYAKDQECRCVVFASDVQVEYKYRAKWGQMFFRDFPTPADIETARTK